MLRRLPILLIGCSAIDAESVESCVETTQFIGPSDPVPMGWTAQRALVAFAGVRQSSTDAEVPVRVDVVHEGGLVRYVQSAGGFAEAEEEDPYTCRSRLSIEVEVSVEVDGVLHERSGVLEVSEPVTSAARARVVGDGLSVERATDAQSGVLTLDPGEVAWSGPHSDS